MRTCRHVSDEGCHSQQLPLPIIDTRFPESYMDGYSTGVEWDGNWMPGGPYVYTGKDKHLREIDESKHELWQDGFKDGLEVRLKSNSAFAAWWGSHRGIGTLRYTEERIMNKENAAKFQPLVQALAEVRFTPVYK